MNHYLFFLIIFLIPIGLASAEEGSNYIKQTNPDGTITASILSYERIFSNGIWKNYNLIDDPDIIIFESGSASFKLDKTSCDFALYEKGVIRKAPIIGNYKMEYLEDGLKVIGGCIISPIEQNEFGISFFTSLNGIKRMFDLNINGVEWTTEYDNDSGFPVAFKIRETCEGCTPDKVEGDKIFFGDYTLDLKNEQHNTLSSIVNTKGNYVIEYDELVSDKSKLIVDPVFGYSAGTGKRAYNAGGTGASCVTPATLTSATQNLNKPASGVSDTCIWLSYEWNISSIPDAALISDVQFRVDVTSATNGISCDIRSMESQPSGLAAEALRVDILDGTVFLSANSLCTGTGSDVLRDLGEDADVDLQNNLGVDWWGIGIFYNDQARDGSAHLNDFADPQLLVTYSATEAVSDLTTSDIRPNSVDLTWSTPSVIIGSIVGYQINSTTPWSSNVATVLVNDTGSTTTSSTVSSLTGSTQYSFRVGVWSSFGGGNFSGNVLDITTDFDPTGSFTPGTFSLNFTGTDVRNIKFERNDTSATSLDLYVTYPNSYNTTCNFYYKFAMLNNTYTNLSDIAINTDEDRATFQFIGVDNEVIEVLCYDDAVSDSEAKYVITQVVFPFLEQIADFKNGTFGTMGQFGALDMITVFSVMVAMIGFNRVNEAVGVIFAVITVGALALLSNGEIISWGATFTSMFAVVLMYAIVLVRRD